MQGTGTGTGRRGVGKVEGSGWGSGCWRTDLCQATQPFPIMRPEENNDMRSDDLNGLTLTLGGPSTGLGQ